MDEWRQTIWGDLISLEYGKGLRGYSDTKGPVRVFGTNGPIGWTSHPLAPGPGVILGRKGAYRGVHYSTDPFFVIDTAYYVVPKCDMEMRWLYYAIIYHKLGEIDDGSPIPSTTRSAVYVRNLAVPTVPEQYAIASTLAALDDKIELNRRMNETLEAMARALFKDWFVDFGPTRAKQEGLEPYLAPELWSLFPERLDAEGKPEEWALGQLNDCMMLQRGFDLPKTVRVPGAYQVIAASGPNGTHSEFKVKSPGVTTGRSGVLGNVFLLLDDFWPLNTSLWVKEFRRSSTLHAYFLLQELDLLALNAGSAVPTLNRNHVHQAVVVLPPQSLIGLFTESLMPMFERIRANEQESRTLAQTRDLLLPKLISGEIRVKDAESVVESMP